DESKPANWVRWDNIDAIMKQYGLTRSDAEQALQEVHTSPTSIFAPETIEDDTLNAVPMDAKPADTKEATKPAADTKVTKPADTKPRTLTDALLVRSESDQSCPTLMLGQSVVNKQIGSNVPKDLAALPSPEEVEAPGDSASQTAPATAVDVNMLAQLVLQAIGSSANAKDVAKDIAKNTATANDTGNNSSTDKAHKPWAGWDKYRRMNASSEPELKQSLKASKSPATVETVETNQPLTVETKDAAVETKRATVETKHQQELQQVVQLMRIQGQSATVEKPTTNENLKDKPATTPSANSGKGVEPHANTGQNKPDDDVQEVAMDATNNAEVRINSSSHKKEWMALTRRMEGADK
ncbi:unnamed protein product, partial [Effrenium voratum]